MKYKLFDQEVTETQMRELGWVALIEYEHVSEERDDLVEDVSRLRDELNEVEDERDDLQEECQTLQIRLEEEQDSKNDLGTENAALYDTIHSLERNLTNIHG